MGFGRGCRLEEVVGSCLLIQSKDTWRIVWRRNVAAVVVLRGVVGVSYLGDVLVVDERLVCHFWVRVILVTHSDKDNKVLDLACDKSLL